MPRLRRSDVHAPGFRRRRQGRGFAYLDEQRRPIADQEVLQRIKGLVIPPAWTDVWISPWPNGHVQAVGVDAAGRRQYVYHPDWRRSRDAAKHERVLDLARRLPHARDLVGEHLLGARPTRERTLAAAFRMLDLGFFRIGSEAYARANGTFGLATMKTDHVRVRKDSIEFTYVAKGSQRREQRLVDADLARVLRGLARRSRGAELLAWRGRHGWVDVRSTDINAYVREVTDGDFTAKDFRTWNATVLMAQALAVSASAADSDSAQRRVVARGVREVADYLGNTPAVARASYVDARVIDLFHEGRTIDPALVDAGTTTPGLPVHGVVEKAVLDLLAAP